MPLDKIITYKNAYKILLIDVFTSNYFYRSYS